METTKKIIRKELFTIAKERGIPINPHWTTRHLANVVTKAVLDLHTTKHLRIWQKRRYLYGNHGMKKVKKGVERSWMYAGTMFAHDLNTGAVSPSFI